MEKNNQAILDMIARYKVHVREHGMGDELYKWELIRNFSGRPNLQLYSLSEEFEQKRYSNLIYHGFFQVSRHLIEERPVQYKDLWLALFDESNPFEKRLDDFQNGVNSLYADIGTQNKQTHHDERSIAVIMAMRDASQYPLYKYSFHEKFCRSLGVKPAGSPRNYLQYIDLLRDFVNEYVRNDQELLSLTKKYVPDTDILDPNHLLLAQNILYVVLDQGKGINQDDNESPLENNEKMQSSKFPLNQILYGPPGTGKTYHTVNRALEILGIATTDRREMKRQFEEKVNAGQIAFVTFHQSMSYEDFVEGIKPFETVNRQVGYSVDDGVFKALSKLAFERIRTSTTEIRTKLSFEDAIELLHEEWVANPNLQFPMLTKGKEFTIISFSEKSIYFRKSSGGLDHSFSVATLRDYFYETRILNMEGLGRYYHSLVQKLRSYLPQSEFKNKASEKQLSLPHILIIDEINRGNVSQIFGELITLIEEDKRAGMPEALSVTLPYSKDSFSVPPNLYLIGTMNTADRSVEALDTALRRRFEFIEMAPNPSLVPATLADASDVSPRDILHTINLRIEKLLDRDHQIGHAYFMEITQLADLKYAFQHKLMPLLQEYFFGDYSKIGLVLGKGFVHKVVGHHSRPEDIFANFTSEYKSDLAQRDVWHLCNFETLDFKAALADLKAVAYPTAS